MAIGNHEFDYGPVGESVVVREEGQDPQGALRARAASADYPFLAANVVTTDGAPLAWDNVFPDALVEIGGISVGVVGVTTEETPQTTLASGFSGLAMRPLVESIETQARELRDNGVRVVVVAAHEGAACSEFDDPATT